MDFFPLVLVLTLPCDKFPYSLTNGVVHISCVAGSFANFILFVIDFPVNG